MEQIFSAVTTLWVAYSCMPHFVFTNQQDISEKFFYSTATDSESKLLTVLSFYYEINKYMLTTFEQELQLNHCWLRFYC